MRAVKLLFGPLPLLACLIDRADRILWVNAFSEQLNGIRERDVRGLKVADVWPHMGVNEALAHAARRSGRPQTDLIQSRTTSGTGLWVKATRVPLGNGKVLCVGQDVSALLKLRALTLFSAGFPKPKGVDEALAGFVSDTLPTPVMRRLGRQLAGTPPIP